MKIHFRSRDLQKCYEEVAQAKRKWGTQVGERFVIRVSSLIAVEAINELYKLPSIRVHQLSGDRAGQYALTIHAQWRLIISLDDDGSTIVIEEVSNHYD